MNVEKIKNLERQIKDIDRQISRLHWWNWIKRGNLTIKKENLKIVLRRELGTF